MPPSVRVELLLGFGGIATSDGSLFSDRVRRFKRRRREAIREIRTPAGGFGVV